jgi:CubicO group peptidase (beta-lactamase class C family)
MKHKARIVFIFICLSIPISLCNAQRLPDARPEDEGMSSSHLNRVRSLIRDAIERKEFPGAVLLVGRREKIVFREAFGHSQWIPKRRSMNTDMIFDLASLTKPIVTATSIMILVEKGMISLWDKVIEYVPEFSPYRGNSGQEGKDVRLWHLLTHTSGLPSYIEVEDVSRMHGHPVSTETLVKCIAQQNKISEPGTVFVYSCLGFITLAHIVEKVSGQDVDLFARENIFAPLKMEHTFFKPSEEYLDFLVPTQVLNGKPLTGVVHDPLARLQSGISGNAGLFSTADDLAVFAQMMLNGGTLRRYRVLSPLTIERMTTVFPEVAFSGRGLGWDLDSTYATCGGDVFGPKSYGHTGYTGTSIWIDPDTKVFVIFLTNRVHPYDKGTIVAMRSKVANVVASSVITR